jgi:hypothetical protein
MAVKRNSGLARHRQFLTRLTALICSLCVFINVYESNSSGSRASQRRACGFVLLSFNLQAPI